MSRGQKGEWFQTLLLTLFFVEGFIELHFEKHRDRLRKREVIRSRDRETDIHRRKTELFKTERVIYIENRKRDKTIKETDSILES